tara:strand:- start:117 stop:983 length:867 start_codon:yes stop_codon:yes gene_type:complete
MKFYDCVMFRDEIDLLRLRIDILKDKVNDFIVFEALNEHLSGKERKAFLNDKKLKSIRSEFPNKNIIHVEVPLEQDSAWGRENEHRIKIYDYFNDLNPDLEDTILISDCDEIPNPKKLKESARHDFVFFDQMYFIHFLDLYSSKNVTGTVAIKWHKLKLIQQKYNNVACQLLRNNKDFGPEIDDGGWHYSYVGGVDQVTTKARTIAEGDQAYERDLFVEQIKEALENKNSPYSSEKLVKLDRDADMYMGSYIKLRAGNITKHQDGNEPFPEFLLNNKEKYKHLFSHEN